MKHLYLILTLLLTMNFTKAQVVSYELIQSFSVADMNQIVSNFGASGAITPSYPVDLYRVYYRTEYNDSMTTVTGALAIPQNA